MLPAKTQYKLNAMSCAMWLSEYLVNKNITGWITYENASHGLGYKADWFGMTMKSKAGREFLLKFFTVDGNNVAACDVWKMAVDIPLRDFKSYTKIHAKFFERLVRESKVKVYYSEFRRRKCVSFEDALLLLFWVKVKKLTSNFFPYALAMRISNLSPDLLREFIMRYNLKQGW